MGIVIVLVLGFIITGVVAYAIGIYNGLVQLHFNMDKAWANIDVLLKQRQDELPKLVDACKGYMTHEKGLLENIVKARTAFLSAGTPDDKIKAENQISQSLKSLFAVAENYPDLKANQNFLNLQSRISGLENDIAHRREFFNESVNLYNIRIHQFPDMFAANMLKYQKRELLKIPADQTKDVDIKF